MPVASTNDSRLTAEYQPAAAKKVSFIQSVVQSDDDDEYDEYNARRSMGPRVSSPMVRRRQERVQPPDRMSFPDGAVQITGRRLDSPGARSPGYRRRWPDAMPQRSTWTQQQQQPAPMSSSSFSYTNQQRTRSSSLPPLPGNCSFCGRQHVLGRANCPTANVQCYNCLKFGHIQRMCKNRSNAQRVSPNFSH